MLPPLPHGFHRTEHTVITCCILPWCSGRCVREWFDSQLKGFCSNCNIPLQHSRCGLTHFNSCYSTSLVCIWVRMLYVYTVHALPLHKNTCEDWTGCCQSWAETFLGFVTVSSNTHNTILSAYPTLCFSGSRIPHLSRKQMEAYSMQPLNGDTQISRSVSLYHCEDKRMAA